jgi:hypothetical protein
MLGSETNTEKNMDLLNKVVTQVSAEGQVWQE